MRLFAGIELAERVKAAAAAAGAELQGRLRQAAPRLVARWVPPENLHITIWFIGEVADPRAEAIGAALEAPGIGTAPFDLTLGGCGAFPRSGPPRVFWIGVRDGHDEAAALYREVGERLAPLGFAPERRAYSAHLTVARVKDPGGTPGRAVRDALASVPADCGTSRVAFLTLFRSRLSPRGAAYEPLLRVPLKE